MSPCNVTTWFIFLIQPTRLYLFWVPLINRVYSRLTPQMSFMDALSQAGGVTKDGNFNELHLIRPSADVNMKIDMSDMLVTAEKPECRYQ